jgi:hypothetical protein
MGSRRGHFSFVHSLCVRAELPVRSDNGPEKEAHLALLHLGILGPLRTNVGVCATDLSAMPDGLRLFPIS